MHHFTTSHSDHEKRFHIICVISSKHGFKYKAQKRDKTKTSSTVNYDKPDLSIKHMPQKLNVLLNSKNLNIVTEY